MRAVEEEMEEKEGLYEEIEGRGLVKNNSTPNLKPLMNRNN
jgi:hypothetical protein